MKGSVKKLSLICLVTALLPVLLFSCTSTPETTSPATPESTPPEPAATTPPAVPESTPPPPIEIIDQLGRTVIIKDIPQKIISLAPSNTEIIYALGLDERLLAVTDYCDYPPEAEEKPSIGGFSTPNMEKIVALDPDLVLMSGTLLTGDFLSKLENYGLTVVALVPRTFSDILDGIALIGTATGETAKAESLLTGMRERINAITAKTNGLTENERPSVFYLIWHDPLMTSGGDTFINEMVEIAGGKNIFKEVSGAPTVELEVVITRNPQVMIAGTGMGSGEELTLQFLESEARLKDTDAVKNGRIYGIHIDLTGRTSPRIVDGLELFARAIHPELFK